MKSLPSPPEPEDLARSASRPESQGGEGDPSASKSGAEPEVGPGRTNLGWGALCVVVGIPLAGFALSWAAAESFVSLATAALLGLLIFVVNQGRLLREKNGLFLLLSGSALLVFAVPIGVKIFVEGSQWAKLVFELSRSQVEKQREQGSLSTGLVPAIPATSAGSGAQKKRDSGAALAENAGVSVDLNAAGATTTPERSAGLPSVAIVPRGGATPLEQPAVSEGASAPAPAAPVAAAPVDFRPDEDPVQRATRLAQEEAIRRYPALAVSGSPEHSLYLDAYNELARLRKFEFFKDPQWPLRIADLVAAREGWKRAAEVQTAAPARGGDRIEKGEDNRMRRDGPGPKGGTLAAAGGSAGALEELALDGPNAAVPADPVAQATNRSIIEVRRRYPALGVDGSPENRVYLEAYRELERLRPDFFEKPEWPIHLAEIVAKREGWRRQDQGAATAEGTGGTVEPPLPK